MTFRSPVFFYVTTKRYFRFSFIVIVCIIQIFESLKYIEFQLSTENILYKIELNIKQF